MQKFQYPPLVQQQQQQQVEQKTPWWPPSSSGYVDYYHHVGTVAQQQPPVRYGPLKLSPPLSPPVTSQQRQKDSSQLSNILDEIKDIKKLIITNHEQLISLLSPPVPIQPPDDGDEDNIDVKRETSHASLGTVFEAIPPSPPSPPPPPPRPVAIKNEKCIICGSSEHF